MTKREMLINYVPGEECRIAITEDGRLEEFYQERASSESHVGNIYKGRVLNVEPSIQAAFVDFGLERNGFLHISDLHPMYFPGQAKEETERVGMKTPRRDRPPIQKCLRRGQEILVQVLKEGIGTKGPTLTSYLSIPGRFLVMMPYMEKLGVSRKVEDDEARRAMREILDELKPPEGFGFIIRTAGIGRTKLEIKRDLAYLTRLWKVIDQKMKSKARVGELYTESDLIIRTIRDVFSSDLDRIIVDDSKAAQRANDFLTIASPRSASKVFVYTDPVPLFHRFGIEPQIENINSRVVPLPSGGSLVIDATEALVAIDVNSGKMREHGDAETTAYKTNVEAVDEICRQLRLRDLGGVVVNDLIDMRHLKHRRAIEQRFRDNLKRDRARTRILAISQFGIVEMTRQRMRPSINKSMFVECPHCHGGGKVKSPESVVLDVSRRLMVVLQNPRVLRLDLTVSPDVAFQLLNRKRAALVALEQRFGKSVMVRVNAAGPLDFVQIDAFGERDAVVEAPPLTSGPEPTLEPVESEEVMDLEEEEYEEDLQTEGGPEASEPPEDPEALEPPDVSETLEPAEPADFPNASEAELATASLDEEDDEDNKSPVRRPLTGAREPATFSETQQEMASAQAQAQEQEPFAKPAVNVGVEAADDEQFTPPDDRAHDQRQPRPAHAGQGGSQGSKEGQDPQAQGEGGRRRRRRRRRGGRGRGGAGGTGGTGGTGGAGGAGGAGGGIAAAGGQPAQGQPPHAQPQPRQPHHPPQPSAPITAAPQPRQPHPQPPKPAQPQASQGGGQQGQGGPAVGPDGQPARRRRRRGGRGRRRRGGGQPEGQQGNPGQPNPQGGQPTNQSNKPATPPAPPPNAGGQGSPPPDANSASGYVGWTSRPVRPKPAEVDDNIGNRKTRDDFDDAGAYGDDEY